MNDTLLEEERLERPFDPNRKTSVCAWTTAGVKKRLTEIAEMKKQSLSTYMRELLEFAAAEEHIVAKQTPFDAEHEQVCAENQALRAENELLKTEIDQLRLQQDTAAQTVRIETVDAQLEEKLMFVVAIAETLNCPEAATYRKLLRLCGIAEKFDRWKGERT